MLLVYVFRCATHYMLHNFDRFISLYLQFFHQRCLITFMRPPWSMMRESPSTAGFPNSRLGTNDPGIYFTDHFPSEYIRVKQMLSSWYFLTWDPSISGGAQKAHLVVQCLDTSSIQ